MGVFAPSALIISISRLLFYTSNLKILKVNLKELNYFFDFIIHFKLILLKISTLAFLELLLNLQKNCFYLIKN